MCADTVLTALDGEPALEASPQVVTPPREEATTTAPETPPRVPTTPTTSEAPETSRTEANGEPTAGAVHSDGAAAKRKPARGTAAPPTMPTAPDWLPGSYLGPLVGAPARAQETAIRRCVNPSVRPTGESEKLRPRSGRTPGNGHRQRRQGCVFPDKHYLPARSDRDGVPRHGARRPWPTPPTDPANQQTAGFATELEVA